MDIIILYPFEYGFLSLTHFQLCSLLGLLDAAHCRIGGRISFLQGMLIVAPIHVWKKNCMPFNIYLMDPLLSNRQFLKIILIGESGFDCIKLL